MTNHKANQARWLFSRTLHYSCKNVIMKAGEKMGKNNFRIAINLIVKKGEKVLLLRRFNTGWNDGKYALMGGHVEDGENPEDAVVREAYEELGIVVDKKDIVYKRTMIVEPDHVYLYYECEKYSGEPTIAEPDQCDDLRFFDIANLPENLIAADKKSLAAIYGNDPASYGILGGGL